jgi:RNA recognition motif-containing protein
MGRKVFVGNLSFDTTSADLETLFGQAGTCESASVITDRATGRSRGFGFVEMGSPGEAAKAIAAFNGHELHGRTLNVSEARERSGNDRPRGGFGRRDR